MVAITTASLERSPRGPSRPVLVVLPPVTRPGARTYARRRLTVLLLAVALIAAAAFVFMRGGPFTAARVDVAPAGAPVVHEPAAYGAGGQRLPAGAVYVVQPGDTVWSIAHKLDPNGDPRALVDRIVSLNGGAALQPGQRLLLSAD